MHSAPDFQQNAVRIFIPLMIPKAQLFNVLSGQITRSHFVLPQFLRLPVLKSVQLNGEARQGTVEIQNVPPERMLAPKLESGESAGAQGAPQLFFLVSLLAAQTARILDGIHQAKVTE